MTPARLIEAYRNCSIYSDRGISFGWVGHSLLKTEFSTHYESPSQFTLDCRQTIDQTSTILGECHMELTPGGFALHESEGGNSLPVMSLMSIDLAIHHTLVISNGVSLLVPGLLFNRVSGDSLNMRFFEDWAENDDGSIEVHGRKGYMRIWLNGSLIERAIILLKSRDKKHSIEIARNAGFDGDFTLPAQTFSIIKELGGRLVGDLSQLTACYLLDYKEHRFI